ncbi:hypothetical protein LOTGIDRAFT_170832 [Lottia gigantea]|uniref:Phospholipase A2-like domain-containing protein n=1 Tax=Lottia gigantea TaxID=225164 RepID=V4AJT0_LOTGI|nr:hypothetical protein LOTGIDRAFT_170832 [Lottia gigantea]ESP04439.1 hypothetical protein LOTGIDRAFT_170832 [Lottia gigantea]
MIVAHAPKTYFGSGDIQKSLGSLPGFPWAKYPGEKHLPGHNYTGPGTRLDLRLDENDKPKPGEEPVDTVHAAALKHDILYRNKDINFRHEADRQMIIELENIPNPTFKERMQRVLIIKLLKAKMKLGMGLADEIHKEFRKTKNFLKVKVKVDSLFFKHSLSSNKKFNAQKALQFINCRDNVEIKEYESNENTKVNHLYEIKTSGKYIDRFRMLIIPDNKEDVLSLSDFDMILQSKTSPSMNIIRNPEPQIEESFTNYDFLRMTNFEYVKLFFVNKSFSHEHTSLTDLFTSIDIHKSQQDKQFIIFSSITERNDGTEVGGIYTCRCMIRINIEKPKFSVHLNKINDSKEQISLVSVIVVFNKPEIIITDNEKIKNAQLIGQPIKDVKHFPFFCVSEVHLI